MDTRTAGACPEKKKSYERIMLMKRMLSLTLSLLLVLPLVLGAVSCAKPDEGSPEVTEAQTTVVTEGETQDMDYVCELPADLTFGNAEVHLLYATNPGRDDEFLSAGLDGGLVAAAVYERNLAVEGQLGVKLDLIGEDDQLIADKVKLDITSGLGSYDIVANGTFRAVTPVINGQYLDLSQTENVDTSKHYWTQGFNDLVTFTDKDRQFLASGPLAISMFRFVFLTLYNKTQMEARNIPDLYETVKAGDWTLDYQYSIITGLYQDVDNDGKKSRGDFYGFVTGNASSVDPYMVASDIHMVVKDPDTKELLYNGDALAKVSDLCDKTQLLYNSPDVYVNNGGGEDWAGKTKYIIQSFTASKALMVTCLFLDMETEIADLAGMSYGIAPLPKFDASQRRYYSYVQDQVTSVGISSVVSDSGRRSMLGAVLESLAYNSYKLIPHAYYDFVLSLRFMQSPESKEVLDLIFDTIQFDFSGTCSNIFSYVVIRDALRPLLSGNRNSVAGSTKSWKSRVVKELEAINASISKLGE